MIVNRNFDLAVAALVLPAFLLFGGLGLIVLGIGAFFWHLAPYRRGVHSEMTEAHHAVFLLQQDAVQTLPGPARPLRYFLELLFCLGIMVLGLFRLENTGFLGPFIFG